MNLLQTLQSENFQAIITIARGGLALAQVASYQLEIREIQIINSKRYTEFGVSKEPEIMEFNFQIQGRNLLLIDDLVDEGITLKKVFDLINSQKPAKLKTLVAIQKPHSIFVPDYVLKKASTNDWVNFTYDRLKFEEFLDKYMI